MQNILKFDIVKHDKIWGNEQWIVSAHPNGVSSVISGEYANMSLSELFETNRQLFGNSEEPSFPLLVKIIEANDHLSVQVHPDDEYALKHEASLGKNECWYVLDCEDGADIVVGHNLENQAELRQLIETNNLESKLDIIPIKQGDFFNVPAGTIHAIRGGTTILEVQQSSDITYRLYDYGRLEDGKPRELHIDKSIDVVDFTKYVNEPPKVDTNSDYKIITYVANQYFTVQKINAVNSFEFENKYDFIIGVALNDQVVINGEKINLNQGFVIPAMQNLNIEEGSEVYISYIH